MRAIFQLCAWISISVSSVTIASHELNLTFSDSSTSVRWCLSNKLTTVFGFCFYFSLLLLQWSWLLPWPIIFIVARLLSMLYWSISLAALTVLCCVLLLQYNIMRPWFAFSLNKYVSTFIEIELQSNCNSCLSSNHCLIPFCYW